MAKVVVKKSRIHGKGIFAGRDFKKGEIIQKWNVSHTLTREQFKKMSGEKKRYVTCLKGKYTLMQAPERYVNHSCDANAYADNFCDIAKRDIKKGEEITVDYSRESDSSLNMKCRCGSKNCRKIIRAYS